jgi:hypothetical protein
MILPCAKEVFIADFRRITTDYASVTREFIEKYNLPYSPYDPVAVPKEQLFEKSFHVGPNVDREKIKNDIMQSLSHPRFAIQFEKCKDLYRRLTSKN